MSSWILYVIIVLADGTHMNLKFNEEYSSSVACHKEEKAVTEILKNSDLTSYESVSTVCHEKTSTEYKI